MAKQRQRESFTLVMWHSRSWYDFDQSENMKFCRLEADAFYLCLIGKSVLASLIIDKCRQLSHKTIWFYCKHGDKQRNTFIALARALISQVLDENRDLLPYIYDKMCSRSESVLSSESLAKELLETFLKTSNGLYIIIDGLDECDQKEEKQIIEYLCSMVKSSQCAHQAPIHCVFVSQSDAIAVKILRGIPKIEIKPSHNHDDIVAFVSSSGADIQNKFRLSKETMGNINGLVVERAGVSI